jgi:hypothetical protein
LAYKVCRLINMDMSHLIMLPDSFTADALDEASEVVETDLVINCFFKLKKGWILCQEVTVQGQVEVWGKARVKAEWVDHSPPDRVEIVCAQNVVLQSLILSDSPAIK